MKSRVAITGCLLVTLSIFSSGGCSQEFMWGSPDIEGFILSEGNLLVSNDFGTLVDYGPFVVHAKGVIGLDTHEIGMPIKVWLGEDKAVMLSNPPQVIAKRATLGKSTGLGTTRRYSRLWPHNIHPAAMERSPGAF